MRKHTSLRHGLELVAVAVVAHACSSGGSQEPPLAAFTGDGAPPGDTGDEFPAGPDAQGAGGASSQAQGVDGFGRPAGMAIGQGASGAALPGSAGSVGASASPQPPEAGEEVEIPVSEAPVDVPPCSGCVELNVDVSDINQRDDFAFDVGAVNVTRVVWTIVVPFNSDQLFVQPFVDQSYGTYTDLDANAFAVGTPVQLIHEYSGAANAVGIAVGSSGAWTGNMTMSVYVAGVTLEGADGASRTFDMGAEGLATRTSANNPQVVFHP
jgi:hypothetical protein